MIVILLLYPRKSRRSKDYRSYDTRPDSMDCIKIDESKSGVEYFFDVKF
ncbi:MAG: hypothetical protein LBP85_08430 [Prevotellaceae bacterium]|nr:hypothetical protein [Prevotellaceae bacterium]